MLNLRFDRNIYQDNTVESILNKIMKLSYQTT
jgi:uncharacterized protein involved in type VI secretion and phage assembly